MSKKIISRRRFLIDSVFTSGGILMAANYISCNDNNQITEVSKNFSINNFLHGVASFDPTSNQVIIWTRYATTQAEVSITWQVAYNADFKTIIRSGEVVTDKSRDYTVAIELQNLEPNKKLYYRFLNNIDKSMSVTGETITLPTNAEAIKLAVCSCSNFQAGLFNVYDAMAKSEADIVVHLGDYIYEYAANEYGTNKFTNSLNRKHIPEKEITTLIDYRDRYKQYRTDKHLQLLHQKKPFICVWDDHEIANDTFKEGAENHQTNEGLFETRKANAIKAYSEYLPVRTADKNLIYRNFNIGNLINLIMLDTRVIGRDKQLEYGTYINSKGEFDQTKFLQEWLNPNRTMLGNTQKNWLLSQVASSNAKWQVLGQQVLMGKMMIPAELLFSLGAIERGGTNALEQFKNTMTELVKIKVRVISQDPTLSDSDIARLNTVLPYNLDAWDGYPVEREMLYASFAKAGKKMICLAGDTHNAWYNDLIDNSTNNIGKEFATSSVTSPGLEYYLGIEDATNTATFEYAMELLISDLNYLNASERGYLLMNFSANEINSKWIFVNTIHNQIYSETIDKEDTYSA
ncbi:MAG: alkaline phosphatase D family protein [Pseudarcicella sp.]|nr:alkaline phosphatase D family protein [Pseudarcicella sp.]MBP6409528.1 alkaline phosphatase D family protein [Pseudarcicella sp.]